MRNDHNEQIIPEPGYSINHVWDCAFTADSQYIFTCSSDNAVRLWKAEDGGPPIRSQAPLPGIGKSSIPVVNALSGYGKMNTNVENGKISSTVEWASKPIREYLGHQRSVTCIALADTPIY
uniref:Uncharacterized protein n=1 Tax=Romanomermis culicivorax TaxID=13658 RepID=A0A915HIC9_ROMCU